MAHGAKYGRCGLLCLLDSRCESSYNLTRYRYITGRISRIMTIEVGSIIEGTVTGITHFGAFVTLPNGKTGLVHISEVADAYVRDIKDYLKESDKVTVKVLSLDDRGKIGLSIKQAQPGYTPAPRREPRQVGRGFEDRLQRFMKDSDERLSDLRKSTDSKRGGRGGGRTFD